MHAISTWLSKSVSIFNVAPAIFVPYTRGTTRSVSSSLAGWCRDTSLASGGGFIRCSYSLRRSKAEASTPALDVSKKVSSDTGAIPNMTSDRYNTAPPELSLKVIASSGKEMATLLSFAALVPVDLRFNTRTRCRGLLTTYSHPETTFISSLMKRGQYSVVQSTSTFMAMSWNYNIFVGASKFNSLPETAKLRVVLPILGSIKQEIATKSE